MTPFKCWIAILAVPFSLFASLWCGYGVISILITSSLLVLSTILFTFSKLEHQVPSSSEAHHGSSLHNSSKQILSCTPEKGNEDFHEYSVRSEDLYSESENNDHSFSSEEESQIFSSSNQARQPFQENKSKLHDSHRQLFCCTPEKGNDEFHEYLVRSEDLYSESGSNDNSFSSEEELLSDVDFLSQSPECSDGYISDEESLIEITIPGGHYKKPKPKAQLQDLTETMFKQRRFMDLLAEINKMNEEGNLIEIDISMGSIKCSRFEIQA